MDGLRASAGLVDLNVSKKSNRVVTTFSSVTHKHKYLDVYSATILPHICSKIHKAIPH